jgi:hypothetical protein
MPTTGQQDRDVLGGTAGDTGQLCRQWTSGGGEGHQAGAGEAGRRCEREDDAVTSAVSNC